MENWNLEPDGFPDYTFPILAVPPFLTPSREAKLPRLTGLWLRPTAGGVALCGVLTQRCPSFDIGEEDAMTTLFTKGGEGGPGRPLSMPTKDDIRIARTLCKLGATDRELAGALARDVSTIKRWMVSCEEFSHACKVGGDLADNRVERGLYQRAVGGWREGMREQVTKQGEVVELKFEEEVLPDPFAAARWLESRRRKDWGKAAVSQTDGEFEVKDPVGMLNDIVMRYRQTTVTEVHTEVPAPTDDAPAAEGNDA